MELITSFKTKPKSLQNKQTENPYMSLSGFTVLYACFLTFIVVLGQCVNWKKAKKKKKALSFIPQCHAQT